MTSEPTSEDDAAWDPADDAAVREWTSHDLAALDDLVSRVRERPSGLADLTLEVELDTAREELRVADEEIRVQRDQLREQYQAALTQANQSYAAVQTARAAARAAQVQVEQAQKGVRDVTISSPISGYVVERAADAGEFVATNNKVATIARTNPLRVRIDIPEQAIATVRPGQSV